MAHIFVSYSQKNREKVDQLVARLQADGFEIWIDRQAIHGGQRWREEIVVAIDTAYAFLLVLSPASVNSTNVRKEVELADDSKRSIIPLLLARVQLPDTFRYQLAGLQRIDYYRQPELKYAELVKVLQSYRQTVGSLPLPATKEAEIVITGIDVSKFGSEEQERLRNFLAELLGISPDDLDINEIRGGSVHAFIRLPAEAAYRLKAAALNRNIQLVNYGIHSLRLTSDRHFIVLKSGRTGPPKSGKSGGARFIGCLSLLVALVLLLLTILFTPPIGTKIRSWLIPPPTTTANSTFTQTPSQTSTATETMTLTASLTSTSTNTFTPTSTFTVTSTPSATATWTFTPTRTRTYTPTPIPNQDAHFIDPPYPILTGTYFYCPDAGNPASITIFERVSDPDGVSVVKIRFWLENQANGELWDQGTMTRNMQFVPDGNPPYWKIDISLSYSHDPPRQYWFQFQFIVRDQLGVETSSQQYRDRVTFTACDIFI